MDYKAWTILYVHGVWQIRYGPLNILHLHLSYGLFLGPKMQLKFIMLYIDQQCIFVVIFLKLMWPEFEIT